MTRQRDSRRQKQYNAEKVLSRTASAAAKRYLKDGSKVSSTGSVSIEACQSYVNHVTTSAWFQRRWGQRKIRVGHKVYGNATWDGRDISLPPWARAEDTILHEIAHALTPSRSRATSAAPAAHGPEFAAILLTLVRYQIGTEAARTLRESYSQHGVKYRSGLWAVPEPTKPVVPRIQQQQAASRIAAKRRQAETEAQRQERDRHQRRLVGYSARQEAATVLRANIKAGLFGPSGSKTRTHALATARLLDPGSQARKSSSNA